MEEPEAALEEAKQASPLRSDDGAARAPGATDAAERATLLVPDSVDTSLFGRLQRAEAAAAIASTKDEAAPAAELARAPAPALAAAPAVAPVAGAAVERTAGGTRPSAAEPPVELAAEHASIATEPGELSLPAPAMQRLPKQRLAHAQSKPRMQRLPMPATAAPAMSRVAPRSRSRSPPLASGGVALDVAPPPRRAAPVPAPIAVDLPPPKIVKFKKGEAVAGWSTQHSLGSDDLLATAIKQ